MIKTSKLCFITVITCCAHTMHSSQSLREAYQQSLKEGYVTYEYDKTLTTASTQEERDPVNMQGCLQLHAGTLPASVAAASLFAQQHSAQQLQEMGTNRQYVVPQNTLPHTTQVQLLTFTVQKQHEHSISQLEQELGL